MAAAYQKLDSFNSLDEEQQAEPLYEDKFCKLFPTKLEIACYYFPTTKSKTILIKDIKIVYYKKENIKEDFLVAKGWGKTCSNIWWACNMSRGLNCNTDGAEHYNIVIGNGEKTYKGFTSTDHDLFLKLLKPLLPKTTEIVKGMP
ncbi:hypothetical protein PRIPAC_77401 [Pristionchus pacificus]|uniref:Uncharacterized protein n=1 Tax=Pristionchus pacificus TaxID=54126 RepID=A0A454XQD7_PRIPA|nr:hypothetical protein PRIPAC_77401 [Pristionchus pacificus]|eukprot:PDM80321.1 hypothetical protein PRIPAC_32900 [Pristionchus pacificus]